jgi:hypothetical protein
MSHKIEELMSEQEEWKWRKLLKEHEIFRLELELKMGKYFH